MAENQVPRLASDARERDELVNAVGHDTVIAREEIGGAGLDVPRLVVVEAGGPDVLLELLDRHLGEILETGILLKQLLGHHIDAGIGALRTQDRREEQLPRVFTFQKNRRLGTVMLIEPLHDLPDALLPRLRALSLYKHLVLFPIIPPWHHLKNFVRGAAPINCRRYSARVTVRPVGWYW